MTQNLNLPYVIQLEDPFSAIRLSEIPIISKDFNKITHITYLPNVVEDLQPVFIPTIPRFEVENTETSITPMIQNIEQPQINYVYQVVCPEKKVQPVEKFKRGRPKKKKGEAPSEPKKPEQPPKVMKLAPRTRSGRVIKFPKHIEQDFKKVETNEPKKLDSEDQLEFKTSEFTKFIEKPSVKPKPPKELSHHQRKRKIAAQYRCPKCQKAYLGKAKMLDHIKKYPDHGPLPQREHNDLNFDVWNYLVDVTQKSPPAQRGMKFCEELTNLLHNILLLTSALFKKVEQNKNYVEVDKVLGNAIGLAPGLYKFNDTELHKDVTVLKLITNTDFFNPVDPVEDRPVEPQQNDTNSMVENQELHSDNSHAKTEKTIIPCDKPQIPLEDMYFNTDQDETLEKSAEPYSIPKIEPRIASDMSQMSDEFNKKTETSLLDTELLSDNSLLNLSNIRSSVDEFMTGGTLLDNSTSSDEVMNVDQFVNERFTKITEADLGMGGASLNLDLPSLDLFNFHS
ncbi:unnamed protein product [Phaedon cochleariae]|uniref:C2H2-type domain-containing protein n=1 Tax=Phaedon cochleariae TaxID=80249 RepID=A0A9P0GVZ2_PHACE|nr:unnamed protein product [Phaedon cochleariae]